MAVILCLETATTNCSVALSIDGKVHAIRELNTEKYSHAEKLHVFIEELLEETDIKKQDLQAIAISKGPGSYTGLRIGVSAAKGLSYALNIPLISVPTLQSLASQVTPELIEESDYYIIPLIDARRMEVYSAVYDSNFNEIRETHAEIVDENSFKTFLDKKKVVFLGDGSEKFKKICIDKNAVFLDNRFPSAREITVLAEKKYKISDMENVAYFEPYYFKEFQTN